MAGKLIVIDGGDGAGKATQTALLVEYLRGKGLEVETMDFPRYTQNTFGKLLRECLDGKRGDFLGTDSRIASTIYAADRFESKPQIEEWLAAGKVVVLDRYVSANMLHQGCKLTDPAEVEEFLEWLDHVEHGIFGLPRPDAIFYLEVPLRIRWQLKQEAVRNKKHGADVKEDVAESNFEHQEAIEHCARGIVASKNHWHHIACVDGEAIRPREGIHADICAVVDRML